MEVTNTMGASELVRKYLESDAGSDLLAEMVKMSMSHIWSGSSDFSPILNAGAGEVGVRMASTFLKACRKSLRIKVRTFWARR